MDDHAKSFWWRIWGRPRRFFAWLTVFTLVSFFVANYIAENAERGPNWNDLLAKGIVLAIGAIFIFTLLGLILSLIPRTRGYMSWFLRRWLFCLAVCVTLIALFYAEENWRGKRAYERAKRELEAKGVVLEWEKFIPAPVPDDLNVFKAPKMQEWFVKNDRRVNSEGSISLTVSNELNGLLRIPTNFPVWGESKTIDSESDARAYLAWSDLSQPQFTLIREALKRPYARMDGDYSNLLTMPYPNVVAIREVARVLAQRIHCELLLHEPDKALEDATLIHNFSRFLEAKPSGKPITLVAAMINVVDVKLYAEVVGKGLQTHAWQEPQLAELQRQLSEVHALSPIIAALETEPAAASRALQMVPVKDVANSFGKRGAFFRIAPRGWIYQNLAIEAPFFYAPTEALDPKRGVVSPRICKEYSSQFAEFSSHKSLYTYFAAMVIPNLYKAVQTTAQYQNLADLAQTACALERYRIANGSYPDSLDALASKFIDKLPHDIIGGGPLKYHRNGDTYVLYSIGWNEKDDGGIASPQPKDGQPDLENGDWVWQYSPK